MLALIASFFFCCSLDYPSTASLYSFFQFTNLDLDYLVHYFTQTL